MLHPLKNFINKLLLSQLIEIEVEVHKLLFDVITTSFHPRHPLSTLIGTTGGGGEKFLPLA